MKQHTSAFKEEIKNLGRQFDSVITYGVITLREELYSVSRYIDGNILKSVMKELIIESSVDIPLNTEINYQIGLLVNGSYEYIDYGNYIVFESEKEEDKDVYRILCYDKMLNSMIPYEGVNRSFPMNVREFLNAICVKLGLTLDSTEFTNYTQTIAGDIYEGLGYTYRDILDEIAQVAGGVICINDNDHVEVRYINNTNDTIDEEYLKDVNVNFGQKYGPVNSIVLSRSAESDNVYIRDEESIAENGLCEIKIKDNQIMNFNNRSEFLPGLLDALGGLEYYINNFSSTGIMYYDLLDRYNVQVGDNTYSCVLFNDEINVTTGLEEIIYTEIPEQTETDYTKADKTDRKINQTYLIVDKQNQTIESVVNTVTQQNNKISQITQTVDSLNSKISDIADITIAGETDYADLEFQGINESEPIDIRVHPVQESISYLYPNTGLFPSSQTYMKVRTIRFIRTYEEEGETKTQSIDYILPDDLLWYDNENYDEFYLNYDSETCQVTKRCKYNADGTVSLLNEEVVTDYEYPRILLGDGDYEIKLLGYTTGYLYIRLMSKNMYTSQFATRAEVTSEITQTAQQIQLEVSETYETKNNATTNYSRLTQTANSLQSQVNANDRDISTLTQTANSLTSTVSTKVGNNEIISKINQSAEAITINANKISLAGKTIALTSDDIKITSNNFSVNANGDITARNANITGTINASSGTIGGFTIGSTNISADGGAYKVFIGNGSGGNADFLVVRTGSNNNYQYPFYVRANGTMYASNATISGNITATSGTFQNCTITNSCRVPASTVSGTLATSTIPNLSASKITSGTMSANRISGMSVSGQTISASILQGAEAVGIGNAYGAYYVGSSTGKSFQLIVQHEGSKWRRLTFTGGILTKIESSW